jgi:hypothetical protein
MFLSWYVPIPMFPMWPCPLLILIFVPVSVMHERNWRRTLAHYAERRREAGALEQEWPQGELAIAMSLQPWLVLSATIALALVTGFGIFTAMLWPYKPPGFDLPINPYDLPFLWSMIVAGVAAVVAGLAVAVDVARSPWARVAAELRRAIYASVEEREGRFARALAADPGVAHDAPASGPAPHAPASDRAADAPADA